MVRTIYITSQKHFIPPDNMICSIDNFGKSPKFEINNKYNKFEYCFDDWTGYFADLLYWDSQIDLNNKTLIKALHKLSVVISRLKRENINPKSYEPDFLLPKWWCGDVRISTSKKLSIEEKKSILMLHLSNMYERLMNIYKKNKIFYCYVCD